MPEVAPSSLLNTYFRHLQVEKRVAERTQALYVHHLTDLSRRLTRLGCDAPERATIPQLRTCLIQRRSEGLSPRSLALVLSAWRGFYAWLGRQGYRSNNPAQGLQAPRVAPRLPQALEVDQAVHLAAFRLPLPQACPSSKMRAVPIRSSTLAAALVELLYGCGLRVAEVQGLDLAPSASSRGWIDQAQRQVHVCGKGKKWRSVPLGRAADLALQAWLNYRQHLSAPPPSPSSLSSLSTPLFIGVRGGRLSGAQIWQIVRQCGIQSGLKTPVHPHMLRHSYASHLLQSSGDLRGVQELLGHNSIRSTQIYTHLDFHHLAHVYDQSHPRATGPTGKKKI
jgi:integrase/recombinase XerC